MNGQARLWMDPASPLVDAGDPARPDPDGDPIEDIGAHWLGESPELPDTGDTGAPETGAPETGEPPLEPASATLLGGCGQSPMGNALVGAGALLLLARRRRVKA